MRLELIKDIKSAEIVNEKEGGMDQWVSTEQAAEIYGCDPSRIRQFKAKGVLKPQNPTDSDAYYKRADVEALAKNKPKRTGRPVGAKTENREDDAK